VEILKFFFGEFLSVLILFVEFDFGNHNGFMLLYIMQFTKWNSKGTIDEEVFVPYINGTMDIIVMKNYKRVECCARKERWMSYCETADLKKFRKRIVEGLSSLFFEILQLPVDTFIDIGS
jgi:hypothetical protein